MPNELIKPQTIPATAPNVDQMGKNNVNITNQNGGVVNINYNIHPGEPKDSAEKLIAIQRFSKQYYQLLVTTEEDVFVNNIVTQNSTWQLQCYLILQPVLMG